MTARDKQPRKADVAPPPNENVMGGNFLPQFVPTSGRCRATHDVPYSLRCIHSADHVPLVKHRDKEMNEW